MISENRTLPLLCVIEGDTAGQRNNVIIENEISCSCQDYP